MLPDIWRGRGRSTRPERAEALGETKGLGAIEASADMLGASVSARLGRVDKLRTRDDSSLREGLGVIVIAKPSVVPDG